MRRFGDIRNRRQRVRRNVFEILLGEGKTFGRIEVADHDQDGVVRRVVGVEEMLDVGERGRVEIREIAVEIVGVRPIAEGDRRQIEPGETAVGLIHHVHADFFFDHVALIAQIFVVDFESAHAVGFKPEHAFEGVGRDGFEIIGDVVIGGAVEHAAGGIDQSDVFHFAGVGRALEHHVLEKMGETAAAERLQTKTDLVIDADGDDRRGTVGRNDHAQTIGQRGVLDGNMKVLHFDFLLGDANALFR